MHTPSHVSEQVSEADGKIVVTTTVAFDKASLTRGNSIPGYHGNLEATEVVQVTPHVFVCLVEGRRRPHPLRIDDTLFLYLSKPPSRGVLPELIAHLLDRLPADLRPTTPLPTREDIGHAFGLALPESSNDDVALLQSV